MPSEGYSTNLILKSSLDQKGKKMRRNTMRTRIRTILALVLVMSVVILSGCDLLGWEDEELIIGSGFMSSIQSAIDASVDGDVIIVLPGTYIESINFKGKNITLRSATQQELEDLDFDFPGDAADFDIVAETIIDGNGASEVIALDSGEERDAEIKGLTVKGGGIGIYVRAGSQVTITNSIIESNSAGGIHLIAGSTNADASDTPSRATITGNAIRNNVRDVGAGIYLGYYSEAVIEENTITNNAATKTSAPRGGGAIGFYSHITHNTNTVIKNNVIKDNTAYRAGGGISLDSYGATIAISGNEISGNEADPSGQQAQASGGGIYIGNCQRVTIYDNDFSNNKAYWRGGAMVILQDKTYGDETTLMTDANYDSFNTFLNNTVVDTDYHDSYDVYVGS